MIQRALLGGLAATALLSGCSQPPTTDARTSAGVAAGADGAVTAQPAAPADPAAAQRIAAINDAGFSPPAPTADASSSSSPNTTANGTAASDAQPAPDPMLVKAQVLLARAGFSPGEFDGLGGSNLRNAVAAYAKANDLQSTGELTQEVWDRLTQVGGDPVAGTYVLTDADASGPWSPETNDDLARAKGLDKLGYTGPVEALAEKFHMAQELVTALNPGVDFSKAGTTVVVAQPGALQLAQVDHIEVDKANAAVRAYDASDKVLAVFPATVGSKDKPSPSGERKVTGVAPNPDYTYDPSKLTWGPKEQGKFVVKAGPNNPVGAVWIDLNAPSYGLHGTPEPKMIGKTASHGCVRMTNWDAELLASAVKPGVKVTFVKSRA